MKDVEFKDLSLVLYQNEDFVNGLYESISEGTVKELQTENQQKDATNSQNKGSGRAGTDVPFIGGAKAEGSRETGRNSATSTTYTQKTTFSNAYRLYRVRGHFLQNNIIKSIDSDSGFSDLSNGDFVEFTGTFAKNELLEVLELITPELAQAFVHYFYAGNQSTTETEQSDGSSTKIEQNDSTTTQEQSVEYQNKSEQESEASESQLQSYKMLASTLLSAIQREFRNDTSTDFYGKLLQKNGTPTTISSVIICDKQFFSNGDSDRLLDGTFRVFGKVIQIQKENIDSAQKMSKFDRNKILKRINQKGLEQFQNWLSGSIPNEYFDTNVEMVIDGKAFKIIPIAIYA